MSDNEPEPENIDDPYAKDTPLMWIFGNNSQVRIIAALLSEADRDLNISDIARVAGISRSAVYDNIEPLEDHGIVTQTRNMGDSTMYQINTDSKVVPLIAKIEDCLVEQSYEEDSGSREEAPTTSK